MSSKVPILTKDELLKLPTGSLLARLQKLRECDESQQLSDRPDLPAATGFIEFKDCPEWSAACADLKALLATREHVPGADERRAARLARAKRNRGSERGNRR